MGAESRIRPHKPAAPKQQPLRFARVKLAIFLAICLLPVIGLTSLLLNGVWLPAAVYLTMSLLVFFLYWRDKRQARAGGWRTPEKILHAVELLGGWPGAMLAQQVLRHKTRKLSFQVLFWLIVLLHEVIWIDRVLLGGNYLSRHFY
ncbi:hypothetical protein AUC61_17460 [Pseudomonas sp. S25]|uniref:DUF1294 domain-containing protein n=1 Tax=Pseudomonas maioricensis TaxID=1766623 RepID=A0ABS9ZL69_9PSED|nr:DUF1294 domain-containing protein [Pseudomonas sp. S25]MCI8211318.1 hypothetical protein [Pseudomonas sp. S25]